jgi:predicted SAM-dependent methyltransferase
MKVISLMIKVSSVLRNKGVKGFAITVIKKCLNFPFVKGFCIHIKNRIAISKISKVTPLKLHLGCGSICLDGYVNIDIEDWAGICNIIHDATKLPMFSDNSVDHIYNHALLEHIPPWDIERTLEEWNRILKPGGTIQIEVPDLERIFQDWFINETLGEQEAINNIYGGKKEPNKKYSQQHHLTGFTYNKLSRIMSAYGFVNCKRLEHEKYHHILVLFAQKKQNGKNHN